MSQQFKAILIDPFKKSVEAITYSEQATHDFLDYLYKIIGTEELSCSVLSNGDTAWYDDNGLRKPWEQQAFFQFFGFPYPVTGRWFIMRLEGGMDRDTHYDCRTTLADLASLTWVIPKDVVVPAPHFIKYDKDGHITEQGPVDGGSPVWDYNNQPAGR